MAQHESAIGPSILAAVSGAVGVGAFLAGLNLLGWIGSIGFVAILVWLILTSPAQSDPKGDGGSAAFWGMSGGDSGGGGDGGAG